MDPKPTREELKNKLRNKLSVQRVSRMNKTRRTEIVEENKAKLNELLQEKRDEEFKSQEEKRSKDNKNKEQELTALTAKLTPDNFEDLINEFDETNLPDLSDDDE
jgi:16S rRNA U1498 N3-methylase RsmE